MKRSKFFCHPMFIIGMSLIAAGCGGENADSPDVDTTANAITGGTLVSPFQPFASVVRIGGCTATKIGNRRFLTAAHCIFVGFVPGINLRVTNALDDSGAGDPNALNLVVDKVLVHPSAENAVLYGNVDLTLEGRLGYDIALVDVTTDTPQIPQSPVNPIAFQPGFGGQTVGYGCDSSNPAHAGHKQVATFNAMALADLQAATGQSAEYSLDVFTHYVSFDGRTSGKVVCPGDSGGPTIRNSNSAIAAVTSSFSGGISHAARTANVITWITNPQRNVLRDGSVGFLLNALSNKCVGSVTPPSPATNSSFCDARAEQTWTLRSQSPGYLGFVNSRNGTCLTRNSVNNVVVAVCSGGDEQSWKFIPVTFGTQADYYIIQNKATSTCLANSTPANNGIIGLQACDTLINKRWIFTN